MVAKGVVMSPALPAAPGALDASAVAKLNGVLIPPPYAAPCARYALCAWAAAWGTAEAILELSVSLAVMTSSILSSRQRNNAQRVLYREDTDEWLRSGRVWGAVWRGATPPVPFRADLGWWTGWMHCHRLPDTLGNLLKRYQLGIFWCVCAAAFARALAAAACTSSGTAATKVCACPPDAHQNLSNNDVGVQAYLV